MKNSQPGVQSLFAADILSGGAAAAVADRDVAE
jgi:hypothetical protein